MDINDYRLEIDAIDIEIVKLFSQRMRVCAEIARYKAQNGLPVFDAGRESKKMDDILSRTDSDLHEYMAPLYSQVFKLSRLYQERTISGGG